jgi:hypothetical protein
MEEIVGLGVRGETLCEKVNGRRIVGWNRRGSLSVTVYRELQRQLIFELLLLRTECSFLIGVLRLKV